MAGSQYRSRRRRKQRPRHAATKCAAGNKSPGSQHAEVVEHGVEDDDCLCAAMTFFANTCKQLIEVTGAGRLDSCQIGRRPGDGVTAPHLGEGSQDTGYRVVFFGIDGVEEDERGDTRTNCLEVQGGCLLYTSPSPRDQRGSRMPSSA